MAEVAACPRCAAQLAMPEERPAHAHAQCPLCDETFPLASVKSRRLAEIRLASAPVEGGKTNSDEGNAARPPVQFTGPPHRTDAEASASRPAAPRREGAAEPKPSAPEKLSDWLGSAQVDTPSSDETGSRDDADFAGRKTIADSPHATEPSIESLLSRFRGEPLIEDDSADRHAADTPEGDTASDAEEDSVAAPDPGEAPDVTERDTSPEGDEQSSEQEPPPQRPPDAEALYAVHSLASRNKPRRRRRSWVGHFVGIVVFGLIGLALGAYGLLWIGGPEGDMLGISRYLPSAVLPESFATTPESTPPAVEESSPAPDADQPVVAEARPAPIEDEAVEPATFEDPVADSESPRDQSEPDPLADSQDPRGDRPRVTLIGAPQPYSITQLTEAMEGAEQARRVLSENSLADDPSAGPEMGRAYAKLCELAQALTFVDTSAPDPDIRRLAARELYQRLFAYGHTRADSGDIAARWLKWTGRPHGGVFFAGDLKSMSDKGSVWEFRVLLGDGVEVAVLSDRGMDPRQFVNTMTLGVVGCVVEDPTSRVEGYTGDAERAVWACHTFRLDEPRFE